MTATLVLPGAIAADLDAKARLQVETAGVLLTSLLQTQDGDFRLLARKICWVPEATYISRGHAHLAIASEGYVPFLAEAEAMNAVPIWIHTHPGIDSEPGPSTHDVEVDRNIADLFRLRANTNFYGSGIFSPRTGGLNFTGYIQAEGSPKTAIDRLWVVGDRFALTTAWDAPQKDISPIYDRSVRAFGGAIQSALGSLKVAVVGCGGTGSAVAEQLVRLGVKDLTLIDPQELSASNVTRVYGSTAADVGRDKVEILRNHLKKIDPTIACEGIKSMVTVQATARILAKCDIVFGCTDDNAGRLILSRFSTYLLCPIVDCGVLLSDDGNGVLSGIDGRVTILAPGQACLICRNRIDLRRAASELMTPEERIRLEHEGYAPGLGRVEPAVVTFTTMVAATAVSELLERLVGYGPTPRPNEILIRFHDREVSTNIQQPQPRHYCHSDSAKQGLGLTEPFLEQTWSA